MRKRSTDLVGGHGLVFLRDDEDAPPLSLLITGMAEWLVNRATPLIRSFIPSPSMEVTLSIMTWLLVAVALASAYSSTSLLAVSLRPGELHQALSHPAKQKRETF
jgi:hypothetical protein